MESIADFFERQGIYGRVLDVRISGKELSFYTESFGLEEIANQLAEISREVNIGIQPSAIHSYPVNDSNLVTVDGIGEVYKVHGGGRRVHVLLLTGDHSPDRRFSGRGTLSVFKGVLENMEGPYRALFPEKGISETVADELNRWSKAQRREHMDLMVLQIIFERKGITAGFYANKPDYTQTISRLKKEGKLKNGIKFYISFGWKNHRFPVFANLNGIVVADEAKEYLLDTKKHYQELTYSLMEAYSVNGVLEELERQQITPGSYFVKYAVFERGLKKRRDHLALSNERFGDYLRTRFS